MKRTEEINGKNILVVPDIHLKYWYITEAEKILEDKENNIDSVVFLGDFVDDWNKEFELELYIQTLNTLLDFLKKHPDTKICLGNHEWGYLYSFPHSGYSSFVNGSVVYKLKEIMSYETSRVIHRIDNCLFMHAGLKESFIEKRYDLEGDETVDEIIELIENLPPHELFCDDSPIWYRPQYDKCELYGVGKYYQIAGHTPTKNIFKRDNLISLDLFSTDYGGNVIGTQEFIVVNSMTGKYRTIESKYKCSSIQ